MSVSTRDSISNMRGLRHSNRTRFLSNMRTHQRLCIVPGHSQEVHLTCTGSSGVSANTELGDRELTGTIWKQSAVGKHPSANIATESTILVPVQNLHVHACISSSNESGLSYIPDLLHKFDDYYRNEPLQSIILKIPHIHQNTMDKHKYCM